MYRKLDGCKIEAADAQLKTNSNGGERSKTILVKLCTFFILSNSFFRFFGFLSLSQLRALHFYFLFDFIGCCKAQRRHHQVDASLSRRSGSCQTSGLPPRSRCCWTKCCPVRSSCCSSPSGCSEEVRVFYSAFSRPEGRPKARLLLRPVQLLRTWKRQTFPLGPCVQPSGPVQASGWQLKATDA